MKILLILLIFWNFSYAQSIIKPKSNKLTLVEIDTVTFKRLNLNLLLFEGNREYFFVVSKQKDSLLNETYQLKENCIYFINTLERDTTDYLSKFWDNKADKVILGALYSSKTTFDYDPNIKSGFTCKGYQIPSRRVLPYSFFQIKEITNTSISNSIIHKEKKSDPNINSKKPKKVYGVANWHLKYRRKNKDTFLPNKLVN